MIRRVGCAVATVVGLSFVLGSCGGKPVVGVLLPTSGSTSVYGESIASGIHLALTDVRQGRLPGEHLPAGFEVVWADSASDPQHAVAELRRLARESHVKLVIGGATSGEARALLPVLDELGVVCLSPSASLPSLTRDAELFFRIYPSDELEGVAAGGFLFNRIHCPSVLLYSSDSEYARGIEPEFRKQYQGTVVESIDIGQPGWEARSTSALKTRAPSAVYVVGYAEDTLNVLRHLRAAGFKGFIVTTSAFDNSDVIQRAGELAEYVIFPLPNFDRTQEIGDVANFVQRYQQTYQRAPDVLAAHGYDAMRLAIHVMTVAKPPETTKIKQALHFEVNGFPGVTGAISFDDYGDVRHNPIMFIVAKGRVTSYERFVRGILANIGESLTGPKPTPQG